MTKAELIELVAERSRLSRHEAGAVIGATLELIEESLAAGGEVSLSGFGRFHVGSRGARAGVHPRTGEPIWVAATRVPRFSAGSALKKAVRTQSRKTLHAAADTRLHGTPHNGAHLTGGRTPLPGAGGQAGAGG